MKYLFFIFFVVTFNTSHAQAKIENQIDLAYKNAVKGVYWALSNIPKDKSRIENDLIADDNIYADVTLYKEVEGVKIISLGYNKTNTVEISIYKSNDNLLKEGYLKKKSKNER